MGVEKLFPRSREIETKVASVIGATEEIQETAKVPSGETATDGAEALETSGEETAVTDGHVSPPSWDAATRTYEHDPMPHESLAAVRKTTVTLFWNAAMPGAV